MPAEVRKRLGVGPGSVIEWEEEGGKVVVRRSGKYTSIDIRKRLFPEGRLPRKTLEEMDEGIRRVYAEEACAPLIPTSCCACWSSETTIPDGCRRNVSLRTAHGFHGRVAGVDVGPRERVSPG